MADKMIIRVPTDGLRRAAGYHFAKQDLQQKEKMLG